ncbi:MAG: phosphatidylserine decarboxylase family protein [Alphaproteobacteria bacterium]
MKIAKEGNRFVAVAGAAAAGALLMGWSLLGSFLVLLALALAAFFRDPDRMVPDGEGLIVAPADGKVVSIVNFKDALPMPDASTRISIFLSPLDVHINRMPVTGTIEEVQYQRGTFMAAYRDEASAQNEQNALKIIAREGQRCAVVQIAGVLARRIVCYAKRGDKLNRGDRFGLIMFGSRTDTYLPAGCRVEVEEGQRVKGGETILGRFV